MEQFLASLRARWLVALGIFIFVLVATAVYTVTRTNKYTATASLVIDVKSDPITGVMNSAQTMAGYIATQVDIASSERVAKRAVKDLKLESLPAFQRSWKESADNTRRDMASWLADKVLKAVTVTPSRESNVITVAVEWPDPKFAAFLANGFAQAFIETSIELKSEPAKQYASWFEDRSRELRADLEAKQKRLSDYQSQNGIIATDERIDIETARLNELSTQLVTIQGLLQDSESRQHQAAGDNESLPEVLQSPLIASLKADLSREQGKLQDIAARLGKNHPDYKTEEAEIKSLQERIAHETNQIVASLGSNTQANLRRENDVKAALEAQKNRVLQLKHQHDQASDLQNDVLAAQRNLDAVTTRLAQSSLESLSPQANVVMLMPAVEPLFPSSPRVMLNLAVGLLMGLLLGVGVVLILEAWDRRVRSHKDLSLLGVPMLGTVGGADA